MNFTKNFLLPLVNYSFIHSLCSFLCNICKTLIWNFLIKCLFPFCLLQLVIVLLKMKIIDPFWIFWHIFVVVEKSIIYSGHLLFAFDETNTFNKNEKQNLQQNFFRPNFNFQFFLNGNLMFFIYFFFLHWIIHSNGAVRFAYKFKKGRLSSHLK